MNRTVSPELLDSLPPGSAAARHSRRDLRRFNQLLGNDGWWDRVLPPETVSQPGLEIGAGDGLLARRHNLHALDLQASPDNWPAGLTWHQADISTFADWDRYPLLVSNLFLHHLQEPGLAELGRTWNQSVRTIIACEPWRKRGFRTGFALLCSFIRAHPVSRHDGRVSVEAGFRGDELPMLLKLDPARWEWKITPSALGMYRMIARRRITA